MGTIRRSKKSRSELLKKEHLAKDSPPSSSSSSSSPPSFSASSAIFLVMQFAFMWVVIISAINGLKYFGIMPITEAAELPNDTLDCDANIDIDINGNGNIPSDATNTSYRQRKNHYVQGYKIPTLPQDQNIQKHHDLSAYPNSINMTQQLRDQFHPVVKFPFQWITIPLTPQEAAAAVAKASKEESSCGCGHKHHAETTKTIKKYKYEVLDMTTVSGTDDQLIPVDDQDSFRLNRDQNNPLAILKPGILEKMGRMAKDIVVDGDDSNTYLHKVGKYDENRVNLYSSELFENEDYTIDGYEGARTLHVGIDLGAPVNAKVYSFWDGVIHSFGYNPDFGDYGYVVVVQYSIDTSSGDTDTGSEQQESVFYALYGHLDATSAKNKIIGQKVKKGQVLGLIGDVHENGGWKNPHVHFQLSIEPPATHDMPGAVAMKDRARALVDYPDPRHVLGELY